MESMKRVQGTWHIRLVQLPSHSQQLNPGDSSMISILKRETREYLLHPLFILSREQVKSHQLWMIDTLRALMFPLKQMTCLFINLDELSRSPTSSSYVHWTERNHWELQNPLFFTCSKVDQIGHFVRREIYQYCFLSVWFKISSEPCI